MKLISVRGVEGSDYINASFIDVSNNHAVVFMVKHLRHTLIIVNMIYNVACHESPFLAQRLGHSTRFVFH